MKATEGTTYGSASYQKVNPTLVEGRTWTVSFGMTLLALILSVVAVTVVAMDHTGQQKVVIEGPTTGTPVLGTSYSGGAYLGQEAPDSLMECELCMMDSCDEAVFIGCDEMSNGDDGALIDCLLRDCSPNLLKDCAACHNECEDCLENHCDNDFDACEAAAHDDAAAGEACITNHCPADILSTCYAQCGEAVDETKSLQKTEHVGAVFASIAGRWLFQVGRSIAVRHGRQIVDRAVKSLFGGWDCWNACGHQGGYCAACKTGACCRRHWSHPGCAWHHGHVFKHTCK